MKKITFILVLLSSGYTFAQEYTFKKIGTDDYSFEMNGNIIINDTLITITSDTHNASKYPVKKEYENDSVKKYKSSFKELNANFILNLKQKKFVYEFKDPESSKKNKMTYILD